MVVILTEADKFLTNKLTSFTDRERKGWANYYRKSKWFEVLCDYCDKPTGALSTGNDATSPNATMCGDCYARYIQV